MAFLLTSAGLEIGLQYLGSCLNTTRASLPLLLHSKYNSELDKELLNISHTGVPSSATTWPLDTDQIGTLCTTLSIFYCTANVNMFFIFSQISWEEVPFQCCVLILFKRSPSSPHVFHWMKIPPLQVIILIQIEFGWECHTPSDFKLNYYSSTISNWVRFPKWVINDIGL